LWFRNFGFRLGRDGLRLVRGGLLHARLKAGFAIEEELRGNTAEIAQFELGVDGGDFVGHVGEFVFVVTEVSFVEGLQAVGPHLVELGLVGFDPLLDCGDRDVEFLGDATVAPAFGAEFKALFDGVLGVP
jgi:hypothetical protein